MQGTMVSKKSFGYQLLVSLAFRRNIRNQKKKIGKQILPFLITIINLLVNNQIDCLQIDYILISSHPLHFRKLY